MTRCSGLSCTFPSLNLESVKKFCFLLVGNVIWKQNVNSIENHCFMVGQCIEASLVERTKKFLFCVWTRIKGKFRISPTRNCIFIVPTNPHVNVSPVFRFLKLMLSRFLKGILGTFSLSFYILIKVYMCPLNLKVRVWGIKILHLYFFFFLTILYTLLNFLS